MPHAMTDFKRDTFRTADDTSYILRSATSDSGVAIFFRVSGVDLSLLASQEVFPDFDALSNEILRTVETSPETEAIYFQWVGNKFHRM